MADERLGASFSIDVTELKAGLKTANKLIKESQSEFKAAAAGMDDWTKSEEGLNAKIKSLNDVTSIQREKVNALQSEYDDLIANGLDPTSDAAITLRTKINEEESALKKNEAELSRNKQALQDLQSEAQDAGSELDDLGDSASDSGDGFTVMKGAMADLVSSGIQGLVSACSNAIRSLLELSDATQEYREDMGKLETAWETAGLSADLATSTYKDFYSALGESDRSVEAVNHLAKFVETEEDMAKWTDICTGVWGAYGDSLPIEGLTEAANETVKTGEVTGVLADALNWAGISQDEFQKKLDACSSESERANLITETLNSTYKESADNYKENNKSIIEARQATSDFADAQAELGEAIEPLTTKITQLKTQGIQWFVDTGLPFLTNNLPAIATMLGGLTAAFIAFKVASVSAKLATEGFTIVTKAQAVAQAALNAVMSANPIGLVILAITALVTAFLLLWKNCEGFRNFFINMWTTIKTTAINAWQSIKKAFSNVGQFFKQKFQAAYKAVTSVFQKLPQFFKNLWSKIKTTFSNLGTKIGSAISGAVRSAINGVISLIENRINSAIGLINGAIGLINKLPGVSVGKVSTLSLPRLAEGGIVNRATTAVIGEDGKEAIVPLEHNTEWINKVAEAVVKATGGGNVVVNQTNNYSQAHSRYEIYKSKQQTAAAVRLAMKGV